MSHKWLSIFVFFLAKNWVPSIAASAKNKLFYIEESKKMDALPYVLLKGYLLCEKVHTSFSLIAVKKKDGFDFRLQIG